MKNNNEIYGKKNSINEKAGMLINLKEENPVIPGCTVSKQIYQSGENSIFSFAMALNTEISPESYSYYKMCIVYEGSMGICNLKDTIYTLNAGEGVVLALDEPVGMKAEENCIYVEISFRKESYMNELLKSGNVFKLGDLLPYQEGKIVNMDLCHNDTMKLALMSFDAGTGLSEHAAPGEALVFALDGEGVIGYEGKEYTVKAGDTFKFDKNGKHSVTAVKQFKMALLLVLG